MKMKILAGLALAFALGLGSVSMARADEGDQATLLKFYQPVRIPGDVLPPGTYWFVLLNHGADTNVVQIFAADRTTLVDTLITGYANRMQPTGGTVVTLAVPEAPSSENPPALLQWFYPGDSIGHQFFYSGHREQQIEEERDVTVRATYVPMAGMRAS